MAFFEHPSGKKTLPDKELSELKAEKEIIRRRYEKYFISLLSEFIPLKLKLITGP